MDEMFPFNQNETFYILTHNTHPYIHLNPKRLPVHMWFQWTVTSSLANCPSRKCLINCRVSASKKIFCLLLEVTLWLPWRWAESKCSRNILWLLIAVNLFILREVARMRTLHNFIRRYRQPGMVLHQQGFDSGYIWTRDTVIENKIVIKKARMYASEDKKGLLLFLVNSSGSFEGNCSAPCSPMVKWLTTTV